MKVAIRSACYSLFYYIARANFTGVFWVGLMYRLKDCMLFKRRSKSE